MVFTEEEREDGSVVQSFFFEGVYEYERIIRVPGKPPIILIRCMGNQWQQAPPEAVPPEGRSPTCNSERQ